MRSRLILVLAVTVGVVVLSGCSWLFRGGSFTKNATATEGEKTVATLKTAAAFAGPSRPLFLVGTEGSSFPFNIVAPRLFDVTEKYVNNPRALIKDQVLANFIVNNDECPQVTEATGQVDTWTAYRTENNVQHSETLSSPGPTAVSKLGFKAKVGEGNDSAQIAIASGTWVDDGDNVVETEDNIGCNTDGGMITWVTSRAP